MRRHSALTLHRDLLCIARWDQMFFYVRVGTEGEHSVILEAIAADFSSVLTNMSDFRHSHVVLVACIELCCYLLV